MEPEEIKIHVCEPDITDLEIKSVITTLENREVSSIAPTVRRFEEAFAQKFGVNHAVAVNSGGSALFLALKVLGIKEGDEVIVPDFTMIATAAAVSHCGAKPVFVDSKANDLNIDVSKIEAKITPKTKAIMPVHIYGLPCDMDSILDIAKRHNLFVVEDAAEAHGAKYKGRLAGTMGTAGCFSFYANKVMTTGEGGMIVTDDDSLVDKLRHYRAYDFDDEQHFWHKTISWNLRMSALEAAVGLAQLKRLDELVGKRRANAEYYMQNLKDIPGIKFFPELPDTFCIFWMFGIVLPERDALMNYLEKNGIETRTFFFPMHIQPVYIESNQAEDFKNAEYFGKNGLYLPSSSHISKEDKDYVIAKVKEFYARHL